MNYYPFHIGDFRSGTVNMSRQTRWIYRDLLDIYYDTEKPLTLDLDMLCDQVGAESDEERRVVERLLRFKFTKTDEGYRHTICDTVITDYHAKAETAKSNGKKSAATRYQGGEYMPGEGVMYAVRASAELVKVGITANMKSRLHQLRSKYGKQTTLLHQVSVARMGDAEADLLAVYEEVRSGEELPIGVASESQLISHMNRIAVAYQVASSSHGGSQTNQEPITNTTTPPIPPKGGEPSEQKRESAISLRSFLDACKQAGEKPVPDDDPVFAYADKVKLPHEFLGLQWREFKDRYQQPGAKRYKAWRTVFLKSVKGNWLKLWYIAGDGSFLLTTQGQQAQRSHKDAA